MIKTLENNKSNKKKLALFLESVNRLFDPELKDRIIGKSNVASFEDYTAKVLKNASCLCHEENNEINALLVIYHNDIINQKAYIPILAVKPTHNGKGIATKLVLYSINICQSSAIKRIFVNTWKSNTKATNLYQKLGFEIINQNDKEIKFQMTLNE